MKTNENVVYQPDEKPSHPVSLGLGFQDVASRMAAMTATTAIVATASGQPEAYQSWAFFGVFVVCGLGTIFQTLRIWRFGSGYPLSVSSGSVFIPVCIAALSEGGPAMLSSLVVVSSLVQLGFVSRLWLLRRLVTPMVAGTVLMLLSAVTLSIVTGRLSDVPAGTPQGTAPVLAGTTLAVLLTARLYASPRWRRWTPVVAILSGCLLAALLGLLDFRPVGRAAWVGVPESWWQGFDLSFGAEFWALLPVFVVVYLANSINSVSETVAIQNLAWRKPRATDFRVVQGGQNLVVLTNLLAALMGTLPNRIGGGNSARAILTGVVTRRMGVYAGFILIAVAFLPKAIALIALIPRPILTAYLVFVMALLFVQGMRMVVEDGLDARKSAVVGVSLWMGVSFQNRLIFPDLLSGTLDVLLGNGVTVGSVCVILLSSLIDASKPKPRRLNTEMRLSALPGIDDFLRNVGEREGWEEASVDRLRAAGEETLLSLTPQNQADESGGTQRLTVGARRMGGAMELEFLSASENVDNLEDRIAYLSDEPELREGGDVSFRLLRHYASSVRHRKYHDIDVVTVVVEGASR